MELKDNNGRLEVELPGALDLVAAGELRDLLLTYHIQEAIGYRNLDRGNWAERRMF